ncbi:MAG TPA: phosphate ABC transporter substrate-binding protein PstS [Burkholderiaceae bacterium]
MKIQSLRLVSVAAALATIAVAAHADEVTGAGSSFAAPIYSKWAEAYHTATGNQINYQSVGSGAGIKQINAKTVDFGASDMPLKDAELAASGLMQFPTVMGGVVPVVNIAGVKPGQLKLTGAVLGDIYLGKVSKWNDPEITALNPGVKLPAAQIATVHRADASGTSFIFTNYLSKVNPEWKAKIGEGTSVNWPANGVGGKGNEGVSQYAQKLPNSIAFVEYAYAKQNKMDYVLMKNQAGAYVSPNDKTFKAAAAGADWSKTYYQVLTDEPGKDSWPITGATFVLIHKVQDKPAQGAAVMKFFDWSYANGDKAAADLDYVTLPDSLKAQIRKQFGQVKDASGKTVAFK